MVFELFFVFVFSHKDSLQKSLFLSKFDEKRNGFSMFLFPCLLSCLSLAWALLESCLSLAWVLLESCFSLASFLLHSCFSLVPRLKLVFRGSYFLLLIGSGRPPRKRLPQGSPASHFPVVCWTSGPDKSKQTYRKAEESLGTKRQLPYFPLGLIGNSLFNALLKGV